MGLPLLFRTGDDWVIPVSLTNTVQGGPISLVGATVTATLYALNPITLSGNLGSVTVTDPVNGLVTVIASRVSTVAVLPQTTLARTYPCRISIAVLDALGHLHTYDPIRILPLNPQDDGPVPTQAPTQVLTACQQGPSGPAGPSGSAPLLFQLNAVATYAAQHNFPYRPRAWIIDNVGNEVETDVSHSPSQVNLVFAVPFTGTLYLG